MKQWHLQCLISRDLAAKAKADDEDGWSGQLVWLQVLLWCAVMTEMLACG